MANWYCSTVGWSAVTIWATGTAYNVGDLRRQTAALGILTVGNERVFRCTTAGTSHATTEPTWNLTKGATTNDNTVVWTEVTGNETYNATTFAAPHARLQTACKSGWPAAGDTIFVDASHAETQAAAMTIAGVGTNTSPLRIICIASTHSSTPVAADLATTATCTTTGAFVISFSGSCYVYGITFSSGSTGSPGAFLLGSTSANAERIVLDNCKLALVANDANGYINIYGGSGGNGDLYLLNTNVSFANASQCLRPRAGQGLFLWDGGTLQGTAPTSLISNVNFPSSSAIIEVRNVDLSILVASKFLVGAGNYTTSSGTNKIKFNNCKFATNLGGVITGAIPDPLITVDMVVSDSTANVIVREEHYAYSGSCIQDTTNFRTGGASDGTTSKAWKVVSLSVASRVLPFYCPDIYQWVNSTGSKTISVYISNNSSVTAQDLDIGFEVEYLNDSGSPLGTFTDTRPAGALGLLSTGTNWGTDTSTWGGSTTNKQVMTKTLTFNQKGVVRVRPFITKASFTVWIDPLITVA